jgi:hypothetical protein
VLFIPCLEVFLNGFSWYEAAKTCNEQPFSHDFFLVLVTHTCNPSYLGGRDKEDDGWRPALAKNKTLFQKY